LQRVVAIVRLADSYSSRWRVRGGLAPLLLFSAQVLVACSSSPGSHPATGNSNATLPPTRTAMFVTPSKAGPDYPTRLAIAADGTVLVSEPRTNQVVGYRGGRRVLELGSLDRPLGIALRGDQLLVGNVGRKDVEIYDLRAGRYVGVLGDGQGEVTMPNSIAVAPDGRVYVADSREDTVKVYAPNGKRAGTIGGTGAEDGQLSFPVAVAADGFGVVVADQGNHRVQVFDDKGRWVRSFGALPASDAASLADLRGRFTTMSGIALKDGDVYVVDSAHGHVQVLDALGASKRFLGSVGDCRACTRLALDLAFAADGSLLVSDPIAKRWVTPEEVTP
jgi:WD40 repeat protein